MPQLRAKHLIAAGLRSVIYLEPYPKSRAANLFAEEVDLDAVDENLVAGKLIFRSFSGVAPRQYARVFSMSERGKKSGRTLRDWERNRLALPPLYVARNAAGAYLMSEVQELQAVSQEIYEFDRALVEIDATFER